MKKGQRVIFWIYDSLFKDYIKGTGVVLSRYFCNLWDVKPDMNRRLSGKTLRLHESCMLETDF